MYEHNHSKFLKLMMHACHINLIIVTGRMIYAEVRLHTEIPVFHLFFSMIPCLGHVTDPIPTMHTQRLWISSTDFQWAASHRPGSCGMNCHHPWRYAAFLQCTCRSQALQGETWNADILLADSAWWNDSYQLVMVWYISTCHYRLCIQRKEEDISKRWCSSLGHGSQ